MSPSTLIIVPGHASFKEYISTPLPKDVTDDSHWVLQSFQAGEPSYYVEHIHTALKALDKDSFVIFSGGRTRQESGKKWSEARTYLEIAKTFAEYTEDACAVEEYARDSFQNLEYSVRKFKQLFAATPKKIIIVGWAFKEQRFRLHAQTLGIDVEYIGVNNPAPEELAGALRGEQKTILDFQATPFGDSGTLLEKRLARDPWGDGEPADY